MVEKSSRRPRKGPGKVVSGSPLVPGAQAPVPEYLSPDEALEWRNLVAQMPPDWFTPETWPLLAALCSHICQRRWTAEGLQQIRAGDQSSLERIDKLAQMQMRETRMVAMLMTRLRLTLQTRMEGLLAERKLEDARVMVQPWLEPRALSKPSARDPEEPSVSPPKPDAPAEKQPWAQ